MSKDKEEKNVKGERRNVKTLKGESGNVKGNEGNDECRMTNGGRLW